MDGYHALAARLFTQHANVRNVKAFFVVKRAKFDPRVTPRGGLAPAGAPDPGVSLQPPRSVGGRREVPDV
jgi:hypothetical protein